MRKPRFTIVATLSVRAYAVDAFRLFERKAAAIMAKHGGAIERTVAVEAPPNAKIIKEVHVVTFADEKAYDAYRADAALVPLRGLRDAAIVKTQVLVGEPGPEYREQRTRAVARIRFARPTERAALEALQRRSSLMWKEYRAALLAHPDAIEIAPDLLRDKRVRVAELAGRAVGFSLVVPSRARTVELDGLFVEPDQMHGGIGRQLIRDATRLARRRGARAMDVTGNPLAEGFYAKLGFVVTGRMQTRFGPGIRMRLRFAP